MSGIDLHTHTTFSDGSFSPTSLVHLADQKGIDVLSITDHDTTAGLAEAMEAGRNLSIEIIPGTELSADFQGRETHILGYFIDLTNLQFQSRLKQLRSTRLGRIQSILSKLQTLNVEVSLSEVEQAAGTGSIGRPHIARVLMSKGYVRGFQEAFERFLGLGGQAFVPRSLPSVQEVITWISEAGGISFLAHPYWQGLNQAERLSCCQMLVEQGLQGLEVYYGTFSQQQISVNLHLARRFNLLTSGGSDFHGTFKPEVSLGKGRGSLHVPQAILDSLRHAANRGKDFSSPPSLPL